MEMFDMIEELAANRTALYKAEQQILTLNSKCIRKNLTIAGLVWLGFSVCKMLSKCEEERKAEKKRADAAEAACAEKEAQLLEAQTKYACECCANYETCSSNEV